MTRLWWLHPETYQPGPAALALLTAEERAQHLRFIPPRKRHEYLVTRVLVRTILGEALGIPPAEVQFTQNAWGRPELIQPTTLRFNVTHTEGLIALIISDEHDVGVDTELLSRAPKLLELGPHVFAPKELSDLAALPADQRAHRAVTLWTLKESYIKARGLGLALSLEGFAFRFDPFRLEVEPALSDDGAGWQFETTTLGPHLVSTALRHFPSERVVIKHSEARLT
jgi:4'-phosphopantetheinyl transferase